MRNPTALFLAVNIAAPTLAKGNPDIQAVALFTAGPVTVEVDNCSDFSDKCFVMLRYGNQRLKIDSRDNVLRTEQKDVHWVDSRYVTIDYGTGGNCIGCEGIEVAGIRDNHLDYLGRFDHITGGYMVKYYEGLAGNDITGSANIPTWDEYWRYRDRKAELDAAKTCKLGQKDYERHKSKFFYGLKHAEKVRKDFGVDFNSDLLYSSGFAKYCGKKKDFHNIMGYADIAQKSRAFNGVLLLTDIKAALDTVEPATKQH